MTPIPDSATKGNPKDQLLIVGFHSIGTTIGSASPFVSKVDTFCRLNDIPYDAELPRFYTWCFDFWLSKSPKQTAPFIKHGDVVLSDSEFIVEYLANTYDVNVKPSKDPRLRGTAVAVKRLCEHHLYYGLLYYRWSTPQGFKLVVETFFKGLPLPLRWFLPNAFRKSINARLFKQGFGRHSIGDIGKLVDSSLCALSDILGENKYVTGESPCPEDASLFGSLDNCLEPQIEVVPTVDMIKKYPNLVAYVENMRNTYFPDDSPSKFAKDNWQ